MVTVSQFQNNYISYYWCPLCVQTFPKAQAKQRPYAYIFYTQMRPSISLSFAFCMHLPAFALPPPKLTDSALGEHLNFFKAYKIIILLLLNFNNNYFIYNIIYYFI